MNGMGTPKDIILMLVLIVGVIAMTAFISAMKIGERMDKSIANTNKKTKEDAQTMKYTATAALIIAAGVAFILILKQFDVISDTFFPYVKSDY